MENGVAEQRTDDWHEIRRGKITSSEVHRLMADKVGSDGMTKGGKTYVLELIAQDLGLNSDHYENEAMRWGTECEAALKKYLGRTDVHLETPPFIQSIYPEYGGSPDAVFGPTVWEIKCPFNSAIHLQYCLITEPKHIPTEYYWQCISNAYLTRAKTINFASFDPRIDHEIGLKVFTFVPIQEEIDRMIIRIKAAIEYKAKIKKQLGLIP